MFASLATLARSQLTLQSCDSTNQMMVSTFRHQHTETRLNLPDSFPKESGARETMRLAPLYVEATHSERCTLEDLYSYFYYYNVIIVIIVITFTSIILITIVITIITITIILLLLVVERINYFVIHMMAGMSTLTGPGIPTLTGPGAPVLTGSGTWMPMLAGPGKPTLADSRMSVLTLTSQGVPTSL